MGCEGSEEDVLLTLFINIFCKIIQLVFLVQ